MSVDDESAGEKTPESDGGTVRDPRKRVARRLNDAGLLENRFINVLDSGKDSPVDHSKSANRYSNFAALDGNYGVYAGPDPDWTKWLVDVDIDDYGEGVDDDALDAVLTLPETLTIKSPHTDGETGGHRYYAVECEDVDEQIQALCDGTTNPKPSWGEVRVHNQYVVGPGSQLDGCDKEWCDECATPDGGTYTIATDAPIAKIAPEQLLDVLRADGYGADTAEATDDSGDQTLGEYQPVNESSRADCVAKHDSKIAEYLALGAKAAGFRADDGGGDRSDADFYVCCRMLEYGAEDSQVYDLLADSRRTKVSERGRDYFRQTWRKARRKVGDDAGTKRLPSDLPDSQDTADSEDDADADALEAERTLARLTNKYQAADDDDGHPFSSREFSDYHRALGEVSTEVYDAYRDDATTVLDVDTDRLDRHRELYKYREEHGPIIVEDGETCEIVGSLYRTRTLLNFEIEVTSFLRVTDEPLRAELTVSPPDSNPFEKRVEPKIFTRRQRFDDELLAERFGMTFDPGNRDDDDVLDDLNKYIASRDAPVRTGTHHMGLHGGEWVTPAGSLTPGGWTDDPETVYLRRELTIERAVALSPDYETVSEDDVERILRDLPNTRAVDRMLPVLGWFYAAPFAPYIREWTETGVNILNVTGDTGSGKTTTLRYLWRCFGMSGDPFDATDTWFVLLSTFGATNSIPVWHDEYKPSDMSLREANRFHDALKKTATGSVAQRGNADKSTEEYHMHAPAVVSGEQQIQPPAERRRSIMVSFKKATTDVGADTRRAFKRLVGSGRIEDGELMIPDGAPDPTHHALAYYQWVTAQDPSEVRDRWHDARETVWRYRDTWDADVTLDDMEIQGLQMVLFGWELYRDFAEAYGVAPAELPGDDALDEALQHVAGAVGPHGARKSHLDRFVELFERAAANNYVRRDTHFGVVHEGGPAREEVRVNINRAYDKLSKYAREHGLKSEDLLDANAYRDRFKAAYEQDGSFVVSFDQKTPGVGRCVGISTLKAAHTLGFSREVFDLDPFDEDGIRDELDNGSSDGDGGDTHINSGPPDDAEGALADAQRLVSIAATTSTMKRGELLAKAADRYDMTPERADRALDEAETRGLLQPNGDDRYEVV